MFNLPFIASTDTAYVRIFISDVNDNKPIFVQNIYEVDVDEDADVGFAVVTVSANDEDEGRSDGGDKVMEINIGHLIICGMMMQEK